MSYFIEDLTGENPAYRETTLKRRVLIPEQHVQFFTPVYLDTIQVVMEGTVTTPLVYGIDFIAREEDYDYDAMGRGQLLDREFDKKLVKSITMIKPFVDPYTVNFVYQQLYPKTIDYILQNPNRDIEITPEVLWDMMQSIKALKMAISPVDDYHSEADRQPMLLPPDPDKIYPGNIIDGELHAIDTSASKYLIFPLGGAFFRDSFKMVRGRVESVEDTIATDPIRAFKEGEDYVIVGVDEWGTKHTSNPSGVYQLVVMKRAYVGDVTITYHAYGGIPTIYDVRANRETIRNMYEYLRDAQILTATTLGNVPLMTEFRARLKALEDGMRKFAKEGQPSYGDCTDGKSILKRIAAPDTEFHWWTIAELFKVAGSDTVFAADMGHFQIQTQYTKMMLDVIVAADITRNANRLSVTTNSALIPQSYTPFGEAEDLNKVLRPQLRIIWNENSIEGSGIYLQLGMRLKGTAEESVVVADLSGMESCWKLINIPETVATLPEDDNITLPSENALWSIDNPDSREESHLIPLNEGHVIWSGMEPLNRPTSGLKTFTLEHFLEPEVDLSKLKTIEFWLEESESNRFIVKLPLCGDNYSLTAVGTFTYANKGASVVYRAMRNEQTNVVTMTLAAEITAGINSNKLSLRHVLVNS